MNSHFHFTIFFFTQCFFFFLKRMTEFLVFQGDCWICMELMATSLDKFYKFVYCSLDDVIPEEILGKITLAVSFGDDYIPLFL